MTRTPDEIKKGLECCSEDGCKKCPYWEDCNMADGFSELAGDALALIQQLEVRAHKLDLLNIGLLVEKAQLVAERDALLKYITDSSWAACDICKHGVDGASAMDCKHIREVGVPCFEWRGVLKEE